MGEIESAPQRLQIEQSEGDLVVSGSETDTSIEMACFEGEETVQTADSGLAESEEGESVGVAASGESLAGEGGSVAIGASERSLE